MGKFYDAVGYATPVEVEPGIYKDEITERNYSGEVLKITSGWSSSSDSTNDDLTLSNRISIVGDPFAYQNYYSIKYVKFMGTKWKVKSIDVEYPRLILTMGGVYNG